MDKYVKRYGDYLVNWFNEDYSSTIRRIEIVNKIDNGYGYGLALDFVQKNAECIMDEIRSDCFNSFMEKAEILLTVKEHLAHKQEFRKVAMHPQRYDKIFYYSIFSDLVAFLDDYLTKDFEVEI